MNRSDWAYFSGYFDGEGCITGSDYPRLDVYIDSCDKNILEWIQSNFGGTLIDLPKRSNISIKPQYRWRMLSGDMIPTLKKMIPFLKVKQQQAYLAMAFRSSRERGKAKRVLVNLVNKIQKENHNIKSRTWRVGKPNKTATAYLAGLIDADGCVYLIGGITPRVKVVSNQLHFLRWIQFTFGGKVYEGKPGIRFGKLLRPVHEWYLNKKHSIAMMKAIIPFIKRKHTLNLTDYTASSMFEKIESI